MLPKYSTRVHPPRPPAGRLFALPAALLAALSWTCLPPAAPPARAAEVTVSNATELREQMATLTAGGTVAFTDDARTNTLTSVITLTSSPYLLNPGGAQHITIMGRSNPRTAVFVNTGDINLTLSNLTLGSAADSAIKSTAGSVNITLADDGLIEFTHNGPAGNHGGAIQAYEDIRITGSHQNLSFTGNFSDSRAGALYSDQGVIIIDPVLTGTLLIENNTTPYTGGAIFAQRTSADALTPSGTLLLSGTYGGIAIQGNATVLRNGSNGSGGALAANGPLIINATVLDTFLIASNTSINFGGAIYAGNLLDITANGPAGIRFANNTAAASGGALYLGDTMTLTANSPAGIRFENNTAGANGGAIFINRSMGITLDAAAGDILFQGNTQGAARTPNAIHGNGAGGNALNITGPHDILILDPVTAASPDANSITKTGPGSVIFGGASTWRGNVTIAAGALLLDAAAHLDTAAPGKTLTLSPGAILGTYATAGSGTIQAETLALSGILYPTGTSQLHLYGATTLNTPTVRADVYNGNQSGLTIIHDTATFNGTGIIDLWSIAATSGTYNVLRYEAALLPPAAFSGTLRYQGNPVGGAGAARVSGSVQIAPDGKTLQVTLPGVLSDYITWTGAAGPNWDLSTENWTIAGLAATAAIGDHITLDDTAARHDITIQGTRLNISGLRVNNTQDYTLAGSGGVSATPATIGGGNIDPAAPAIGKLIKDGPGKLTFANAAANTFENGVDWNDGALSITNGNQLGAGPAAAITLNIITGTLHATGTAPSTLATRITPAPGAPRALTIENTGAPLTLAGPITGATTLTLTGTGLTALTGTNTFTGTVTLTAGSALALAADTGLGRSANPLHIAGDTRLHATAPLSTARTLDIGPRTLEITTAPDATLTLAGAPRQLTGTGTLRLAGALHAAAPAVLAATVNWDIATGGLLTLTGAQSAANLRNNGTLRFHDPSATLTAATLSGNGAISMEIDLDAAPAAPRLIITGQADGRHRLDITTIGEPDDPRDIHIPLVTYATGDATFTSNTITDPEGNAYAARQDGGTVTFVFTGNNTGGDVICITSGALGMDWHYSLDSLRQRMGEVRGAISPTGLIAGTGDAPGVMGDIWFRANLYRLRADAGLVGAAFDQTSYDLTAGLDRALALDGASLLLGGFATMTRSNRDHDINDSKSDSDGIGAGLYATLLGKTGWHLDLIAKYHHYTNTIDANNGDRRVTRGDYASNALGASLELGRRLTLKKRLWTELSAQAAYARFAHGDYTATSTTGKSRPIRVDAANSLQTRAQLRAGADLGRWQPHARLAGVFNAASGGTPQVKGFTPAKPDFSGWRLEAGAGATLMVDERTLLYLDYEYNQAETYRRPWAVALGLRRTW